MRPGSRSPDGITEGTAGSGPPSARARASAGANSRDEAGGGPDEGTRRDTLSGWAFRRRDGVWVLGRRPRRSVDHTARGTRLTDAACSSKGGVAMSCPDAVPVVRTLSTGGSLSPVSALGRPAWACHQTLSDDKNISETQISLDEDEYPTPSEAGEQGSRSRIPAGASRLRCRRQFLEAYLDAPCGLSRQAIRGEPLGMTWCTAAGVHSPRDVFVERGKSEVLCGIAGSRLGVRVGSIVIPTDSSAVTPNRSSRRDRRSRGPRVTHEIDCARTNGSSSTLPSARSYAVRRRVYSTFAARTQVTSSRLRGFVDQNSAL